MDHQCMYSLARISNYLSEKIFTAPTKQLFVFSKKLSESTDFWQKR